MLTKNALLFSQSELSICFKFIIGPRTSSFTACRIQSKIYDMSRPKKQLYQNSYVALSFTAWHVVVKAFYPGYTREHTLKLIKRFCTSLIFLITFFSRDLDFFNLENCEN